MGHGKLINFTDCILRQRIFYYYCYKVLTPFWWETWGTLPDLVIWSPILSMQTSLQDWGHNSIEDYSYTRSGRKDTGSWKLWSFSACECTYKNGTWIKEVLLLIQQSIIYTLLQPSAFLKNLAHTTTSLACSYWYHWRNSLFKEVHSRSKNRRISQRFKEDGRNQPSTSKLS